MASSRLTGSQIIGKALRKEGVENVFTLAGDHILPALDAMSDMDFRFIDTRHEAAAVHIADAWGRITGRPGVAMYTTPGFANAIPGLTNALHSESPVLSISGSAPLSELGRGAMQEIDQAGLAAPVTKGTWTVTDPRRIPQMVSHALRVAYSGRQGPVHLIVPIDIQQRSVPEDDVVFHGPPERRGAAQVATGPDLLVEAISLLQSAERPLVIAGTSARYSESSAEAVLRFIDITRLPVMTEGDARGLVSDDHACCLGFYDAGLNRTARMLGKADVVLLLGRRQDVIIGYAMPPTVGPDARIIQVDPSAAEIGRNRDVEVGIAGDVGAVVKQLADEAEKHTWREPAWLPELRAEREAQIETLESLAQPEVPMHAMQVYKALLPMLRPDDHLIFDGGDFCHFGRAYLPARTPKSWWYFSPLGMLGTAFPMAMAAKLADPSRRAIVFTGDGSFGFNAMEFDTAVRHNLPFVTVLGNDAAWGIDRQIQIGVYGRPVATDLLPTRYDRVVEGLGGYAEHVDGPNDLPGAMQRAFDSGRPALLNVSVQRAISPRAEAAIARWTSETPEPF